MRVQKLPGFRDFFAFEIKIREFVINTFKQVFEKYGYEPLETPALENSNIFVGELGDEAEKLFYRFKDQGDRDIMLKYDVMTSMCRAVSENMNSIVFPYKRYQIQTVWRSEKPQKGRYREFTQCDADTIGSDSLICDAEFIQMGIEALSKLGFKNFRAFINSRKLLQAIVSHAGARNEDFVPVCVSVDKLPKIGQENVKKELIEKRNIKTEVAQKILDLVTFKGDSVTVLKYLKNTLKDNPDAVSAIKELETIFNYLKIGKVSSDYFCFAPYIARGLSYYTGPVWEFQILEGNIGSVAGCGRYDNIIERFTGKPTPATGGSFGIDRLVEIIKEKKMFEPENFSAKVLITVFNKDLFKESLELAVFLRKNNVNTLLYPNINEKLDKQLKYANRKQIPYAVIIGPDEKTSSLIGLKNLSTKKQENISREELLAQIA